MASEKYDSGMAHEILYVKNLKMTAGPVEMHFITIFFDTRNVFFFSKKWVSQRLMIRRNIVPNLNIAYMRLGALYNIGYIK